MTRIALGLTVAIAATLLIPATQGQESQRRTGAASNTLELGKSVTGELDGTQQNFQFNGGNGNFYHAKVPVNLRAGQSISISASVTGSGRRIVLGLLDPKSATLGMTRPDLKTTTFKIPEVNATGKYSILVLSDLTGPFTLRVVDDGGDGIASSADPNLAILEKRVNQLEHELLELKKELQALKTKVNSK